jgi:hypothetical protein
MAISTQITTFANIAASNVAQAAMVLDRNRTYIIRHNAVDVDGSAATGTIYFSVGTVTASMAEASDKLPLLSGKEITVGPGLSGLNYLSATNAPTFLVVASATDFGLH